MTHLSLRQHVFSLLDGVGEHKQAAQYLDIFLMVLITANVAAVVLETVASFALEYGELFGSFEAFSVAIFSVEYIARVWSSVDKPDLKFQHPVTGRIRYILTPMAIVDLLAVAPFYLAFFFVIDLRFVRVLRLLRLLKLTRHSAALSLLGSVLYTERRPLAAAGLVMLVLLIFASSFIYLVERHAQPEAFGSIPAAMWWGMATLTTVGYGDVTPVTPLGKILGSIIAVLGVGMFAMPAGILASGFAQALRGRDFVVSWSMVASVPIFSRLEAGRIADIVSLLKPMLATPGEVIVREGDEANCMYFISSGEATVEIPGQPVTLKDGDIFGELALLDNSLRLATVRANTTVQLLALYQDDFADFLSANPNVSEAINRVAQERRAAPTEENT